jgi:1-acyl-sn-glycerol-3-phosphate acyltransferase
MTVVKKLNYYWRILATGWSFASFSAGGLFLAVFIFPLLRFFIKDRNLCKQYTQIILHYSFRFFLKMMSFLGIMHYDIQGAEQLQNRAVIVIANHPTLLDYVLLISVMPKADCIVKQQIWYNFFMRGVVKATCYISNIEPDSLLTDCKNSLASGYPIIIFPEGTRSQPGGGKPSRFQRGAAYIAIRTQSDIIPIFIHCQPGTLTKDKKWYQIPDRPFHLRLRVGNTINIASFLNQKHYSIEAQKLTLYLENLYQQELAKYE